MREAVNAAARPFPWHALASTTRAEARAARGMRLAAERIARVGELSRAMGELTGARVEALLRRVSSGGAGLASGAAGDVGVLLARADDPLAMCLVEAEGALAAALAARALRRKPPAVVDAARGASEELAGALAAILVAAARRAHAGAPLTVRGAGASSAIGALAASLGGEVATATFTVLVDDDAYLARASVPRAHALRESPSPWDARALAALGDTPLRVPVIAAATLASAADIAALSPGDAWIPGEWPLGARAERAGLAGPVVLAPPASDEGLRATLGEDGRLVLVGERVGLAMDERNVNERVGQALGDVPVVVRVEIGAAELRAREWAALGAGDVLALGTKIADPVVLRVGGVEVARGELVEIDGEVGVRILSRRAAPPDDGR